MSRFQAILLCAFGSAVACAVPQSSGPPPHLSLGAATLHLGKIQSGASISRVRGVELEIAADSGFPRSWSFELVLFDDRNGDGLPHASELLVRRQALGSRPEQLRFPDLRFPGRAVRPHAQVRFRDGPNCRQATVPLPSD